MREERGGKSCGGWRHPASRRQIYRGFDWVGIPPNSASSSPAHTPFPSSSCKRADVLASLLLLSPCRLLKHQSSGDWKEEQFRGEREGKGKEVSVLHARCVTRQQR